MGSSYGVAEPGVQRGRKLGSRTTNPHQIVQPNGHVEGSGTRRTQIAEFLNLGIRPRHVGVDRAEAVTAHRGGDAVPHREQRVAGLQVHRLLLRVLRPRGAA